MRIGPDGASEPVQVEVTFTQDGDRIGGRWHTTEATRGAAGRVTGSIQHDGGRTTVDVVFSFAGSHPFAPAADAQCQGSARAEGQLTYNTTVSTDGGPSPEQPGWGVRLKAFEGFSFDNCPAIRYATWTLARQRKAGAIGQ